MHGVAAAGPAAVRAVRLEGGSGPPGRAFSEVLGRPGRGVGPAAPAGPGGLGLEALGRLDAGRRRLDEIIARGRAGQLYRPGELLALQAEVHRIGEEAALVQRVAEEGVGAVKKLWSIQL